LALSAGAQDLTPRAYVITPVGSNAVIFSYVFNTGEVLLDPTLPITDVKARFQVPVVSGYRSFGLFGRSANVAVSVPYGYGHFEGKVYDTQTRIWRSGLGDARIRFSMNLYGGRAMTLPEYPKYRERLVIGASITMVAPTGQYDRAKLVNVGTNRWAFKPEIGLSRRWGRWALDAYAGAWLFTNNVSFFPGTSVRQQNAMESTEFHFGYYLRPRLWMTFDSNLWLGGNTVVNGIENDDRARNSRLGGTVSVPINRHQSFKFSASRGAIVRVGGNFTTITAGWQYSWISKPR
jgi:hypothetical protein